MVQVKFKVTSLSFLFVNTKIDILRLVILEILHSYWLIKFQFNQHVNIF